MNESKLIVVLGMHRSGTSAITRGLVAMGVGLGDNLMPPIAGVNDKGFWEDVDINALNIEMLRSLASDWDRFAPIRAADIEALRNKGYLSHAVGLLRQKMQSSPVFGLKDPRISNLLPFWKEVFRHCGLEVGYVLALRNPLSVAKSLAKRDGFPEQKSHLLWLKHVVAGLLGSVGEQRILVDYDFLMASPNRELTRVASNFGLKIEPARLLEYNNEFLDASLRHAEFSPQDLAADDACPPAVKEIYAAMRDVAANHKSIDDAALRSRLMEWQRELDRMETMLVLADKLSLQIASLEQSATDRVVMLDAKDDAWSARVDQTARDFKREIARIGAERDAMLGEKDAAWSARLDQTARDFEKEIARIGAECDAMLGQKDAVLRHAVPRVSVITVNFNGRVFLPGLLHSLSRQTLPPAEIIVVDNASSDGSVEYLQQHFPYVRVVRSESNLGFAGGNNLGVEMATSPLVALINNDTEVEPNWLEHLVGTWVSRTANGEKIGAVSPKIRFFNRFLTFRFRCQTFTPGAGDRRELGVAIDLALTRVAGVAYMKPIVGTGFHGEERWPGDRIVRWTNGDSELMLPVVEGAGGMPFDLHIAALSGGSPEGVELEVYCADTLLGSCRVSGEFTEFKIAIPAGLLSAAEWVVNNAGSRLDRLGNAEDIGINQPDRGLFDAATELEAFCGCSVLLPRNLFMAQDGFDERFFMYYEDADLSWRIRRSGYRIVYEPNSVVRHIHAGSSVEWSPGFRYHVIRNSRLNAIKNAGLPQLLLLLMRLSYRFFRRLPGNIGSWYRQRGGALNSMTTAQIEFKALGDAIAMIPAILSVRLRNAFRRG